MAIIISEERKQFNWLPVLMFGILIIFVATGAYLLFFTSAPLIEYIAPSSQKKISDISAIKNDEFKTDLGSAKKELQSKTRPESAGLPLIEGGSVVNPGRTNPFLKF